MIRIESPIGSQGGQGSTRKALVVRAGALAAAVFTALAAHAQQGEELEQVKIVATRAIDSGASALGQRLLLDTPFSINAINAAEIEKYQSVSLPSVFSRDASVARDGGTDYNMYSQRLTVRGLSLDWVNSIRVNGLPLTYYGATLPLESVEQVQLLKGSSGFLYGFGAPGGIVNYLTKRPTDQPLLSFGVGFRSDALFSQHVDAGGRLGDDARFGYRVNLVNETGDTYSGGEVDRKAGSISLDYQLTDNLRWVTDLLYQRSRVDRPEPLFVVDASVYRADRLPAPVDASRTLASDQSYSLSKFGAGTTGLEWRFASNWDFKINFGVTDTDYRFPYESIRLLNGTGTYANRLADYYDVFEYDFARALVQGQFETGRFGHDVTAGVSYQNLEITYGTTNYTPVTQNGGSLYDYAPETWNNIYPGTPPHGKGSHYLERSAYFSDTLAITPKLSLLGGLRLTKYLQESFNVNTGARTSIYEKSINTPTIALIYKPAENITAYASYVQSLQQGTTVGIAYANYGETLDPIESEQYEVGIKFESDQWAASASVFRLSKGAQYVDSANYYVQGGEQRYDGLELGGRTRLGEQWVLGASLVYLDSAYEKGVSSWLLGRRLPGASRFTSALDISYEVAAVPGLSLHADAKYLGDKIVNSIQAANLDVLADGYVVANLGGSYRSQIAGRNVVFRAEVQNLFDKEYWDGAGGAFSPGAPRILAVNAKVNF